MRQINKKADQSIYWIIALVVGLIFLVIIVLKFTGLWDKATSYFGGNSLTIAGEACKFACTSSNPNSYCKEARTIKGLSEANANNLTAKDTTDPTKDKYPGIIKTKKGDTWTLTGVTCETLNTEKLILLGECTPPICSE